MLKRQLFDENGRLSQAALRVSAALVIEAIQFNHVDASLSNCDLSDVHQLLLGPDFERFVRFAQPRRQKGPITLAISAMAAKNDEEEQLFIDLSIEREGPVIALSDLMEFPFDYPLSRARLDELRLTSVLWVRQRKVSSNSYHKILSLSER